MTPRDSDDLWSMGGWAFSFTVLLLIAEAIICISNARFNGNHIRFRFSGPMLHLAVTWTALWLHLLLMDWALREGTHHAVLLWGLGALALLITPWFRTFLYPTFIEEGPLHPEEPQPAPTA